MIYAIQGREGTPIKIGFTRDEKSIQTRIASIQTGYPYLLRILMFIEGGTDRERELHRMLYADRLLGEWFEARPRAECLVYCINAFPNDYARAIEHFRTMEENFDAVIGDDTRVVAATNIPHVFGIRAMDWIGLRQKAEMPKRCIEVTRKSQVHRYYPVTDVAAWLRENGLTPRPSVSAVHHMVFANDLRPRRGA